MSLLQQIVERGNQDASLGERLMMFIKQKGFTLIGSGKYARVYGSASSPFVIKIFRNDPCYTKFLSLAAKANNPHFSRLLSVPKRLNDQDTMVKIENLSKASSQNVALIKRISQGFSQFYDSRVRGQDSSALDAKLAEWVKGVDPKLVEAVKLLHDVFGRDGCYLDMDSANIMQRRDGTVVIIDPANGKLAESRDRIASFVRVDEIPERYKKYPMLGRGTTSIALDRGKDVLVLTRDRMKRDWLQSQGLAEQIERFESYHKSIPAMSEFDIYVLSMPKLYKLDKENKKRIVKLCNDFEMHRSKYFKSVSRNRYEIPQSDWNEFAKFANKERIFKNLFTFLADYHGNQFVWDVRTANFMQTARGRVVVLDPIVCQDLMTAFFKPDAHY